MGILVIDVGTSSVRAAVVDGDGRVRADARAATPPDTPFPGLVEFDAAHLARETLRVAAQVLAAAGPVDAVALATQRASSVVWDGATGQPVGPGIGWQDLRTVGDCLVWQASGLRLAPNQSATKIAHLLALPAASTATDLRIGTIDSWIVWHLTGGSAHVTDLSNAAVTGLIELDGSGWSASVCATLGIDVDRLPRIVDSTGIVSTATALDGAPPIAGIVGDQQASLVGQGCVRRGMAKATFGTGGMLDLCLGAVRPSYEQRSVNGGFPIVAWREDGAITWGTEGIMLSAGSCVEWLCEDLGIIGSPAASHEVASACDHTDGVVFVPALMGLGTPQWDFGARGTLLGLTRGSGRPHIVRAVLEGIAQRGADLLDAAEADSGLAVATLRVDGGMSANPTFVQALADAIGRPVELSIELEATTLGAAHLAGLAVGTWSSWDEVAALWRPRAVVEPATTTDRDRWRDAVARAGGWYPDLSGLDF